MPVALLQPGVYIEELPSGVRAGLGLLCAARQALPLPLLEELLGWKAADGETAALQAELQRELQLTVQQFGWNSVETLGWGVKGSQQGMASLAAIAGVS